MAEGLVRGLFSMFNRMLRGLVLKVLYPFLMFLGAFFKKRKEGFQRFVISLNNKLIRKQKFRTKKILLLLPHCLQIDKCTIRLTHNI